MFLNRREKKHVPSQSLLAVNNFENECSEKITQIYDINTDNTHMSHRNFQLHITSTGTVCGICIVWHINKNLWIIITIYLKLNNIQIIGRKRINVEEKVRILA